MSFDAINPANIWRTLRTEAPDLRWAANEAANDFAENHPSAAPFVAPYRTIINSVPSFSSGFGASERPADPPLVGPPLVVPNPNVESMEDLRARIGLPPLATVEVNQSPPAPPQPSTTAQSDMTFTPQEAATTSNPQPPTHTAPSQPAPTVSADNMSIPLDTAGTGLLTPTEAAAAETARVASDVTFPDDPTAGI